MYFAAQEGRLDALRFLHTKAKCNMNAKNADGWSPIHAASQGGHADVIEVRIMIRIYDSASKPGALHYTCGNLRTLNLCICSNANHYTYSAMMTGFTLMCTRTHTHIHTLHM